MVQQVRKWILSLTPRQRQEVERLARSQKVSTLISRRARVLLLADQNHSEGRRTDETIADLVGMTRRQVQRIRLKCVQQGLSDVLQRTIRSDKGVPKTFDGAAEARLVTLCCSTPPKGHQRWTLNLLVDELTRLQVVASVCRETVRKTLKKIV